MFPVSDIVPKSGCGPGGLPIDRHPAAGYRFPVFRGAALPELPEVETTRRGIEPHLKGRILTEVLVREPRLRWPVPPELPGQICGQRILDVGRRGKYLLLHLQSGTLLVHLGMSGSLRILSQSEPPGKHDHVDLITDRGTVARFNDPRRFGAWLWTTDWTSHPLLSSLGPEPLSPDFSGAHLFRLSRGRKLSVKHFIMDSRVVVGVGNIYANEALFLAGIDPRRAAGRISSNRMDTLADTIRRVLENAIEVGGTTLRDFVNSDGKPGYFRQSLQVYGREGQCCRVCGSPLRHIRLGQRSTVFCAQCQR